MKTSMYCVVGAVACMAAAAQAQVTFTTGHVDVRFSWTGGDALLGYEDPSTVWIVTDSVDYSGDYGHCLAAMPQGNGTVETFIVSGKTAFVQTPSGWGFYDMRERHLTYDSNHLQNLTISQDCSFSRDLFTYGYTGPFDSATLLNLDLGGAPIDLLTTTTGFVSAGHYQWQTSLSAEWTNDVQYGPPNGAAMTLHFESVPSPGSASLLALGSMLACRRRRTAS